MLSLLRDFRTFSIPLGLGLGLAVVMAGSEPVEAQTSPRETSISTGSGEGTGTGAGLQPGTSGSPSATSTLDPLRPGIPAGASGMPLDRAGDQGPIFPAPSPPLFPPLDQDPRISGDRSSGTRLPSELGQESPELPTDSAFGQPFSFDLENLGIRRVDPELVREIRDSVIPNVRRIGDPADRALAFDRVARSRILFDEWNVAFTALIEGGQAAVQIQDDDMRNNRLMSLASTSILLAEELAREATVEDFYVDSFETKPSRTLEDRLQLLEQAHQVMAHAGEIVAEIENTNFESFTLMQLAENQAVNSQAVSNFADRLRRSTDGSATPSQELYAKADMLLVGAESLARRATLPIWRDQALVRVTASASASGQFTRGFQIARNIPDPIARADALIRLAEAMARARVDDRATQTYQAAAEAVASIQSPDPRASLAAVLLDSLLSVGRFEDSRSVGMLVRDPLFRVRALAAIARSMGEHGLADQAYDWIDGEVEPELRDRLRREVSEGIGVFLQKNRPNPQNLRLAPDRLQDLIPSGPAPSPGRP